jgi:hypothetical protein
MKPSRRPGTKASSRIARFACFCVAMAIARPARGEESSGWLRGDEALVAKIRNILTDRGLQPDLPRDEGGFVVVLRDDGQSVHVTATWPDGRVLERIVGTPEMAATVVESLDRHDLADPLLAPRHLPARAATPEPTPPAVAATYVPIQAPVVAAPGALPPVVVAVPGPLSPAPTAQVSSRFFAGLGSTAAVGTDGSIALGATVSSCFAIGRACLGARLRYLDELLSPNGDGATGGDPSHVYIQRSNLDVLAAIELPIPWGAYYLVPGAAFGARVVFLQARVRGAEVNSNPAGADAELSMDVIRVFGNGLALSLGISAQALLGRVVDGSTFDNTWISGQPRWSMLGNAGVRFYP